MKLILSSTTLILIMIIGSCTITKRVHSGGYHVEWKSKYSEPKSIDTSRELRISTQDVKEIASESAPTNESNATQPTELAVVESKLENVITHLDKAPELSLQTNNSELVQQVSPTDSAEYVREYIIPKPIYEVDSDFRIPLALGILLTIISIYIGYGLSGIIGAIIGILIAFQYELLGIIVGIAIALLLIYLINLLILNLYNRERTVYYSVEERKIAYRFYALFMTLIPLVASLLIILFLI